MSEGGPGQDLWSLRRGPWVVGGRLRHFIQNWRAVTSDQWTLRVVTEGYRFSFVAPPPLTTTPLLTQLPTQSKAVLMELVDDLLKKQAVVRVPDYQTSPGYYSTYFLVTKADGGYRPILNLKRFNGYMLKERFRMETLRSILLQLQRGDFMFSLDLKDAYLHVPIHPRYHKYLRFAYVGPSGQIEVFQWVVLPFGHTASPRIFTKVLVPVVRYVHRRAHRLSPYIDDLIGAAPSPSLCLENRD